MADFEQSAAARQAMEDAARTALYDRILSGSSRALAGALGVSQRTVERWRAWINKERGNPTAAQRRNPEKALPKVAALGQVKLSFRGAVHVGGNPKYRRTLDIALDLPGQPLLEALSDPDEAWQSFFDEYVFPGGTVEDIGDLHFEV